MKKGKMTMLIDQLKSVEFESGSVDVLLKSQASAMVEAGEYEALAHFCMECFESERILDPMLWFYLFYSEIDTAKKNITTVLEVIKTYGEYFGENEHLAGNDNALFSKQLFASLRWFYSQLKELVTREIKKLLENEKAQLVTVLSEHAQIFHARLPETLKTKIDEDLSQCLDKVAKIKVIAEKEKAVAMVMKDEISRPLVIESEASEETVKDALTNRLQGLPLDVHGKVNSKWCQLTERISLLVKLLKNEKILESAVVYADLQQKLEQFDPMEYFPECFVTLYEHLDGEKLQEISDCIDQYRDSTQWQVLNTRLRLIPHKFDQYKLEKIQKREISTQNNNRFDGEHDMQHELADSDQHSFDQYDNFESENSLSRYR